MRLLIAAAIIIAPATSATAATPIGPVVTCPKGAANCATKTFVVDNVLPLQLAGNHPNTRFVVNGKWTNYRIEAGESLTALYGPFVRNARSNALSSSLSALVAAVQTGRVTGGPMNGHVVTAREYQCIAHVTGYFALEVAKYDSARSTIYALLGELSKRSTKVAGYVTSKAMSNAVAKWYAIPTTLGKVATNGLIAGTLTNKANNAIAYSLSGCIGSPDYLLGSPVFLG